VNGPARMWVQVTGLQVDLLNLDSGWV